MRDFKDELEEARELRRRLNEAVRLFDTEDDEEAKKLLAEIEEAARKAENGLRLQEALMYEGLIDYRNGDYDSAVVRFQEQEAICRRLGLRPFLVMALGNQALALAGSGDFQKSESALRLFEEIEGMCREENDEGGLWRTLTNKGRLLYGMEFDHARAREVFRESVEISRKLGSGDKLAISLTNEAECLGFEELAEIRRLCEEALPLAEGMGDQDLIRRITGMLDHLNFMSK